MKRWFPEYTKGGITAEHDFGFAGVDQDLTLKILPHDIHKAKVELTMMDGVVRYRDGI